MSSVSIGRELSVFVREANLRFWRKSDLAAVHASASTYPRTSTQTPTAAKHAAAAQRMYLSGSRPAAASPR